MNEHQRSLVELLDRIDGLMTEWAARVCDSDAASEFEAIDAAADRAFVAISAAMSAARGVYDDRFGADGA